MSKTPLTDKIYDAALRRLAQGDTEALTVIYDRLGRQIYMLAYSILGNVHMAEDIMQDTFLRLLSGVGSYREGTNAKAYILKITHNLSLNALQKMRREAERTCPIDEEIPAESDTAKLPALESLRLLTREERLIVVLKLDGGETHAQIASILGITPAASAKRYRRALEKLKEYYRK